MSIDIAVLGAPGVSGRRLLPRLAAAGHRVRALVRRPAVAGVARACGAEIRVADIVQAKNQRARDALHWQPFYPS
jgi:uncharacterized protein YbjT (DUF2867 family)